MTKRHPNLAKIEAFHGCGQADLIGSHDMEDVINVLDGHPELHGEIATSNAELGRYLATRCRELLATSNFMDALPGLIFPDASLAERLEIAVQRVQQIADLHPA